MHYSRTSRIRSCYVRFSGVNVRNREHKKWLCRVWMSKLPAKMTRSTTLLTQVEFKERKRQLDEAAKTTMRVSSLSAPTSSVCAITLCCHDSQNASHYADVNISPVSTFFISKCMNKVRRSGNKITFRLQWKRWLSKRQSQNEQRICELVRHDIQTMHVNFMRGYNSLG